LAAVTIVFVGIDEISYLKYGTVQYPLELCSTPTLASPEKLVLLKQSADDPVPQFLLLSVNPV
jgi:hypothetical protein